MTFPKKLYLFLSLILLLTALPAAAKKMVKIQGSTTVFPIAQESAKVYMRIDKSLDIVVESSGSGNGIKALIDGTIDIANASRFIKDKEAKMAYEKGHLPIPFKVAYDCIIPIVHKSNPLKDISLEHLRDIYSGHIKNWKDIGGNDAPILLFSRDTSSGTFEVWKELVMGDAPVTPTAKLKASNSELVETVMNSPNAIGYIGIGYLNSTVKPLAVNRVTGSQSSAIDGRYPVTRPLFMFTRGWPEGEIGKFINFMLEPSQGQRIVKEAGYLSIYLPASSEAPCPKSTPCPEPVASSPCKPCETQTTSLLSESANYDLFLNMNKNNKTILVQKYLDTLGYIVGAIDGIWGEKTFKAYTQFQKDNNIKPIYSVIAYPVIKIMQDKIALANKDEMNN